MNEQCNDAPIANRLLYWLVRGLFRLAGWRVQGPLPDTPRYVVIATHTSNWDWVFGVGALAILTCGFHRFPFKWMGKQELFRWPLGGFLKWTGGIPVDRSAGRGLVEQAISAFTRQERLVMVVTPEGTRKRGAGWKTGFYRIAHGAGVPILCGFIDYRRKVVGAGPVIKPGGDIEADLQVMRVFYRSVSAKFPRQVGEIAVLPSRLDPQA